MKKKIKVIVKDPEKPARVVWISNTLENLQKTVGGYIETVTISTDAVIICNEEGNLLDCHTTVDFADAILSEQSSLPAWTKTNFAVCQMRLLNC